MSPVWLTPPVLEVLKNGSRHNLKGVCQQSSWAPTHTHTQHTYTAVISITLWVVMVTFFYVNKISVFNT